MGSILVLIAGAGLIVPAILAVSFFVSSVFEKEKRAAFLGAVQAGVMVFLAAGFFYIFLKGFFDTGSGLFALFVIIAAETGVSFLLIRRTGGNEQALKGTSGLIKGEVQQFDERDHVFARNRSLLPGSEQYKTYYSEHPEIEEMDSQRRKKGGPLGIPGKIDSPGADANLAGMMASLSIPQYLSSPEIYNPLPHIALREKLAGKKIELDPSEASARIKGYARNIGADLVGIAEINPLWIYSKRGEIFNDNWEDWGKEIEVCHKFAVVFATRMNQTLVKSAPHTPTCVESMANYAKGAYIATQAASYIANLGFSATANHFRHYDSLMVPMAVDAGLGELGRHGYLITKKFGPRVRLSLVTTDLELACDQPVDLGVEAFCSICRKCARCCPSQSIPLGDQTVTNGILRWKMEAQSCFEYWGKVGTDCNICMNVCPWSHADTFPHQVIKALITRNTASRKLFNLMDDLFYGKRPKPDPAPDWAGYK